MKKTLYPFLLSVLVAGCQHQTPQVAKAVNETVNMVAGTPPHEALAKPIALAPRDTLTPAMLAVLQRYNLAPLLQTIHGTDSLAGNYAQNGFFGPEHYRIEVVFTDVQRDSVQPAVYHLRGQDRYKSVITPFTGTLTITQLADQAPYSAARVAMARKEGYELKNEPNLYSVLGNFELREEASHRGAGVFSGRAALDWGIIEEDGSLAKNSRSDDGASQGGWVKFEGVWTNAVTHRAFPVVWVDNIFTYAGARNVFQDFLVGERDVDFNPKYAKLGWNSYWENDEWWAKSPKPKLSL